MQRLEAQDLSARLRRARATARSSPQYVIDRLGKICGPDTIFVAGVGQHQMWASQFISYEKPVHLDQLRRPRHDGLRGAGGDGREGRPAGRAGVGDRRRRLLPDDQPGAHHLRDRGHPDQGRGHQQRLARHGAAVADAVLRGPLLQHRPEGRPCEVPAGLRDARRGDGLRRAALRDRGRRRRDDREGDGGDRRAGRRRLRRRQGRDGVADGRRRHVERRHQDRARDRARLRLRDGRGRPNEPPHAVGAGREQARRARARLRAVLAGAGSTSTRSRSARPSTPTSPG